MIEPAALSALIRAALPDAEIELIDLNGTRDHYQVVVRSSAFAGKPVLDRHRLVEAAVAPARADGRLHALQIRTVLREN